MTSPLAILYYKKLLPGTQMVTRLEDLSYRVEVLNDPTQLHALALHTKPMVVLVEVHSPKSDIIKAITTLRKSEDTSHIPVVAFSARENVEAQTAARTAGAHLMASEDAILDQLPSLLDHVLEI